MTVQQAVEHVSAGRLADSRGNAGDGGVGVVVDIHTLIVVELSMSNKWHTAEDGSEKDKNDANVCNPLPDRSVPARRVQEVRRELGPHHSSMRRPPGGLF